MRQPSDVSEYKSAAWAPWSRERVKMSFTSEKWVTFASQEMKAIQGTIAGGCVALSSLKCTSTPRATVFIAG